MDATLGGGGHAELILERLGAHGRLLGVDWDPAAVDRARSRLAPFGERFVALRANFRRLPDLLASLGWKTVDGLLLDLGVSSLQILGGGAGMAFNDAEVLDMRTDPEAPLSAQDLLRTWSREKLASLFGEFGEGRRASSIARDLQDMARRPGGLTARQASEHLSRRLPRRGRVHPATRIFLALRSAVNRERENLEAALTQCPALLGPGGVMAVISFHSGEDRVVKHTFRRIAEEAPASFELLTRKPLVPGDSERRENPRARSAKLRALGRKETSDSI